MEPVSAVALAANLLQFVEFACRIVSKGNKIYHSANGVLPEHADLELVARDLLVLNARLRCSKSWFSATGQDVADAEELRKLFDATTEVALQLQDNLNKLKVAGRFRRWKSLRQALKSIRSKNDVDSMAKRLTALRDQIQFRIAVLKPGSESGEPGSMLDQVRVLDSDENAAAIGEVSSTTASEQKQSLRFVDPKYDTTMRSARIEEMCLETLKWLAIEYERNQRRRRATGWVMPFTPASASEVREVILSAFEYTKMGHRYESIDNAYKGTFNWIFEDPRATCKPWDSFVAWLRDGSGIYWIHGKPASGKTTLMRFIIEDARSTELLRHWAGHAKIICAKFFLWNLGSAMQKSQVGLIRSLISQIIFHSPDLAKAMWPQVHEWVSAQSREFCHDLAMGWQEWQLSDLATTFHMLLRVATETHKICLFIDGLDEYDGDHVDLCALLSRVALLKNLKICVSSRPLMTLEQELSHCPQLRLQDLTAEDIRSCVFNSISQHPKCRIERSQALEELSHRVARMSCGVFLWVKLVLKSLLTGLTNDDDASDLDMRLREFPPELEPLYVHMLRSIRPGFYLEQGLSLLRLLYLNHGAMATLLLYVADDEDLNLFLCRDKKDFQDYDVIRERIKRMQSKIRTRTTGLLECVRHDCSEHCISTWNHFSYPFGESCLESSVQYMHLTVKDFLEKPGIWSWLTELIGSQVSDPFIALLRAEVYKVKGIILDGQLEDEQKQLLLEMRERILFLARRAENSTRSPPTDLLDEAQWALSTEIFERILPKPTHLPCSHRGKCSLRPSLFLEYALSRGLKRYVDDKIPLKRAGASGYCTVGLLMSALIGNTTHSSGHEDFRDELTLARLEIAEHLLSSGLDPNTSCQGRTAWQQLLFCLAWWKERSMSDQRSDNPIDSSWLKVCNLFVLYGADPRLSLDGDQFRPFKTDGAIRPKPTESRRSRIYAYELVTWIFSHLPRPELEELKVLMMERGAKQPLLRRSSKRVADSGR